MAIELKIYRAAWSSTPHPSMSGFREPYTIDFTSFFRYHGGNHIKRQGFLASENLKSFISEDLANNITTPSP